MKNQENIKEWYIKEYPTDEAGTEIKSTVTFNDVFEALNSYKSFYKTIGVGDSLIRERIFTKLSEIMQVEYEYIYN